MYTRRTPGWRRSRPEFRPLTKRHPERPGGGARPPVQQDLDAIWNAISARLRGELTDFSFHIWLEPLAPAAVRDGTLFLRAPLHSQGWLRERWVPRLREVAASVRPGLTDVEIVGPDWSPSETPSTAGGAPAVRLNPKFTFEQFVIGETNRFAHAAALAVAEQPAQAYNPLFIHGPPGLGKTHLLHAIGAFVGRYGGGLSVRYATAETFMSEFVATMRSGGDSAAFKDAFRGVDLLLVDDVQFFASKERTKEEFFHTFNALKDRGAQVVLTSDRPPVELDGLEDRLRERFASGLVVEITAPDAEVRLAILRQRARHDGLEGVADETLRAIADIAAGSVRALEAALIRVVASASLDGRDLSAELARHVLGRLTPRPERDPTIREIQECTASAFGLTRDELLARNRRPEVAFARKLAMYLARELTDESLPTVGELFGGRNHTTVLHAHRRIREALPKDPVTAGAVERVRNLITAGDRPD